MQLSPDELKWDADYILDQLASLQGDFQGLAQALMNRQYSLKEVEGFIKEAINHLHSEEAKTDYKHMHLEGVTKEACLVIMVIAQWQTVYMCKRLLQLLTAEALILSRK